MSDIEWLRIELTGAELAEELSDREFPAPRTIPSRLQDAVRAFNLDGVEFVRAHFDTFLSVIVNEKKLEWAAANKAFDCLQRACAQLAVDLEEALKQKEIDPETRQGHHDVLRMLMYLYVGAMKMKDNKTAAETAASLNIGKRGKKDNNESEGEWQEGHRRTALEQVYHLLQLPLHRLWDPPLTDDSFVDMIAQPCYRLMEDPIIKSKTLREVVFDTLGILNKKYNHGLSCTIKLVQMVQLYEHAVVPICNGIKQLITAWELNGLVSRLVRELGEALEGTLAGCERDGPGAGAGENLPAQRNCAQFITELTQLMPLQMIPAAQAMRGYLENDECYPLRSSVLGMFCEILSQELKGEGLTEEKRAMRDEFLEDLEEHLHDVSAYVRSKALQYWGRLQREGCVPINRQQQVLARIVGRLEDKASMVRKSAVQVVKVFLEHNPFSAELSISHKEKQLVKEKATLQSLQEKLNLEPDPLLLKQWEEIEGEVKESVENKLSEPTQEGSQLTLSSVKDSYVAIRKLILEKQYSETVRVIRHVERMHPEAKMLRHEMNKDDQVSYILSVLRSVFISELQFDDAQNDDENLALIKKHEEQENIVAFLEDSISFSKLIQQTVPLIYTLLMSKQSTDVNEAIDFFTVAHSFNIESANLGTMGMLQLVWSPDQEKRTAVDNAYRLMYLSAEGNSERHRAASVAQSLVSLVKLINRGQAAALQALLARWLQAGHLSDLVIKIFWEMYTLKHENISEIDSLAALSLLIMIAKAKPTIASANLEVIQSVGFNGSYQRKVLSVQLILAIGQLKQYLPKTHPIFDTLKQCLFDAFFNSKKFAAFGTTVVDIIYSQCETPDMLCLEILSNITDRIEGEFKKDGANDFASYPVQYIERILVLLGCVALQQLIYLDVAVYGELRRRNEVREQRKTAGTKKKLLGKNGKVNATIPLNSSSASAASRLRVCNQSALSCDTTEIEDTEEQCLEGAVADDTDAENLRKVCEEEVVCGGILSKFAPMLQNLLQMSNAQLPKEISAAACLTLGRFMLVSSIFCEENIQLLMSLLKNTSCSTMRCNIVITLSDLTLRFPNVIQPWTHYIYERLEDPCVEVRQCTVKMLSYLILQEMVRVRGQVAGLARCCVDDDPNTRTMARLFFKQLSQKGNALYNVIPDIISRLSDPNLAVPEDHFRIILKYVMSLIQKDRQMEALVEKLCLRFKLSTDERQWRDLAFCLSLFNYNDRSVKKLIENMDCYKDKLFSKEVHNCFKTIITNTNKLAKADLKAAVAELNDKIEEVFTINGGEDPNKENENEKAPVAPSTPRPRKPQTKKPRNRKSQSDDSDEDDFQTTTPLKEKNNPEVRGRTPRRKAAAKKIYDNDSDDSDGESSAKNDSNVEKGLFKKPTGKVYRKRKI